jgi:hypothetical protein
LLHPELYLAEFDAGLMMPFDVKEFRVEREVRLYRRSSDKPMPAVRLMAEILQAHMSR